MHDSGSDWVSRRSRDPPSALGDIPREKNRFERTRLCDTRTRCWLSRKRIVWRELSSFLSREGCYRSRFEITTQVREEESSRFIRKEGRSSTVTVYLMPVRSSSCRPRLIISFSVVPILKAFNNTHHHSCSPTSGLGYYFMRSKTFLFPHQLNFIMSFTSFVHASIDL